MNPMRDDQRDQAPTDGGRRPRVRKPPPGTARGVAAWLLAEGFHPVAIYSHAEGPEKKGKAPIGKGWGLERPTPDALLRLFAGAPGRGVGVCLGPGKAPGGRWLVDLEGDGEGAEGAFLELTGGEVVDTMGWSSARGSHRLFVVDGGFLDAVAAAGGVEQKGAKAGVWKLPDFPGLEIRIGGTFPDGRVKQVQSVCPPTIGTDGEPREWGGCWDVAEMPDAAFAKLAAIAAAAAPPTIPIHAGAGRATVLPAGSQVERYARAGVDAELAALAGTPESGGPYKGRNGQLNVSAMKLGQFVAAGVLPESEAVAGLLDACRANGLGDGRDVAATIRSGMAKGLTQPRDLSGVGAGRNGRASVADSRASRPASTPAARPVPEEVDVDDVEVVDRWPRIDPAAFYGLAGEVVMKADPHTEASPAAVLVQFLAAFGCMIDRSAYFQVGATRHYLKINAAITGPTGVGRKGAGWDVVEWLLGQVDPKWAADCITGGLVSGEGLIDHVRDDRYEEQETKDKKTGRVTKETVLVRAGVAEKRLLVVETEMSRMLKAAARETNTLSDVVRQAWETDRLRTMGKTNPSRATGAHICIIGHTTQADVRKHLTEADSANGFANRFLWTLARRSKCLPDGGDLESVDWKPTIDAVRDAAEFARYNTPFRISRDPEASRVWRAIYPKLTAHRAPRRRRLPQPRRALRPPHRRPARRAGPLDRREGRARRGRRRPVGLLRGVGEVHLRRATRPQGGQAPRRPGGRTGRAHPEGDQRRRVPTPHEGRRAGFAAGQAADQRGHPAKVRPGG